MAVRSHQGHQKPGVTRSGEAEYICNLDNKWIQPGVKWPPNPAKLLNLYTKAFKNVSRLSFKVELNASCMWADKQFTMLKKGVVFYKPSRAKFADPLQ